jgi:hypothetical protein
VARDARPDAAVDVDFKDRDIDGLLVPLGSEKLYLSGHLQMETRAAVASSEIPELGAIGLTLRPDPCFAGASEHKVGPANATAAATRWQVVSGTDAGNLKASFSNLGVLPGRYRVFVEPLLVPGAGRNPSDPLQNAYVKSIRMGDVDVLSGGLELRSPPQAPLTIEIGAGPGMFKGRVLNERGLTVSAATVVLIPEAGWRFHAAHPLASTNDAGQFEFRGVPPGDYKAFAWEVMQNGAWQDPEFMRDYEARGTPIHIDEGKNSEREIVVISLAP